MTRLYSGLDGIDGVVVPLVGGHDNCLSQVLGVVAGGSEDGPLLSGDVVSSQIG
jgi:hypothetical protein